MKNYFLSILLVSIILNFPQCQVPNSTLKSKKNNCLVSDKDTEESLFKELRVRKKDHLEIIHQEIQCARNTLTTKNLNDYVVLIDKKYESSFKDMKKHETTVNDYMLFVNLSVFLKEIGTESAFKVLMKYFSVNKSLSELVKNFGDSVDDHFGLRVFKNHILPLLDPSQEEYYKKLYDDLLLSLLIESKLDENYNPLHDRFYPIFKQDWESRKIKLRTTDTNQEKK